MKKWFVRIAAFAAMVYIVRNWKILEAIGQTLHEYMYLYGRERDDEHRAGREVAVTEDRELMKRLRDPRIRSLGIGQMHHKTIPWEDLPDQVEGNIFSSSTTATPDADEPMEDAESDWRAQTEGQNGHNGL